MAFNPYGASRLGTGVFASFGQPSSAISRGYRNNPMQRRRRRRQRSPSEKEAQSGSFGAAGIPTTAQNGKLGAVYSSAKRQLYRHRKTSQA